MDERDAFLDSGPQRDSIDDFLDGGASGKPHPQESNPSYEVAAHSSTFAEPTPPSVEYAGFGMDPRMAQIPDALLTNKPVGAFGSFVRGTPAAIGGAFGSIAGIPGAALGSAGAEGLRQIAAQIYSFTKGEQVAGGNEVASNMAIQGLAGAAGQTLSVAGKAIAPRILPYLAKNLSGVPAQAVELAKADAQAVGKYVGAGVEAGDQLAENLRRVIGKAITEGEEAYPRIINAVKEKFAGKTFDLSSALSDKVLEIGDKYGFQNTPNLASNPGAAKFWKFAGQIDNLSSATIDQVHGFQQQLNGLAREYAGKPLGAAFSNLRGVVRDYLGQQVPEIGQANAAYAAAKTIEEQTGKIVNANDLLGYVTGTYNNPQDTLAKQALEGAAQKVPGMAGAIEDIKNYNAGRAFTPMLRSLPQTGMGATISKGLGLGGAALLGGAYTHDPLLAAGGAALAGTVGIVTSPRAALAGFKLAQSATGDTIAKATQAGFRFAPGSLAAYYQSLSHNK